MDFDFGTRRPLGPDRQGCVRRMLDYCDEKKLSVVGTPPLVPAHSNFDRQEVRNSARVISAFLPSPHDLVPSWHVRVDVLVEPTETAK